MQAENAKKQDFKKLWICRVNAAVRNEGLSYSSLRNLLKKSSINLNLKMLAQLSILDKKAFSYLVQGVKN
jgi:large subunit ribosomal protein L20